MRGAFMKLFDYISGGNSAKAKIPMTAPVLTKIEPGQGPNCESTFTMSFYNPYNYQVCAGPTQTLQAVMSSFSTTYSIRLLKDALPGIIRSKVTTSRLADLHVSKQVPAEQCACNCVSLSFDCCSSLML